MTNFPRAKPHKYQRDAITRIEQELGFRCLLSMDMGLGKTLTALWAVARERVPTWPCIVICPASVKYTWEHEAARHLGIRATVLEGQSPPSAREARMWGPGRMIVINYDILRFWVPTLRALNPQTVIIDECQNLINRNSKKTKATRALCKGIPNVLALSGTPLVNRPAELWPTLNILWPADFPSFFAYGQAHCDPKRSPWGWTFNGATNLDRLNARLNILGMIRYRKEDVLPDLPRKVRRVVPCDLTDREEYAAARDDFVNWLRAESPERAKRAAKAAQLTKIGYLLRLAARLKLPSVLDWAQRLLTETDEKLVLFACHTSMIRWLSEGLDAKHVIVDGSITGRRRQAAVQQFAEDRRTRLFIGNIKAAGTGINGLQGSCSNLGFAELYWRPGDHVQAEDRLHRIGQRDTTFCSYLVAGGTIEETLCRVIQRKQATIRATLDGRVEADDLNVFDALMEELRREGV